MHVIHISIQVKWDKDEKSSQYYMKALIIDTDKIKIGLLPLAIKIHTAIEGSMFPNVEYRELFL